MVWSHLFDRRDDKVQVVIDIALALANCHIHMMYPYHQLVSSTPSHSNTVDACKVKVSILDSSKCYKSYSCFFVCFYEI